jgi:rubrerythrin
MQAGDERGFRRELSRRRERQARAASVYAAALALVVGGGVLLRLPEAYWIPLAGLVGLAGLVFSLANWKCPACGERLASRRRQQTCPGCGRRIAE